jgi:hypothetical protein
VPRPEVMHNRKFRNMVKYFHAGDSASAAEIQTICKKYYQPVSLEPIKLNNNKVAQGTIEVWVYADSSTYSQGY